MDKVVLDTDIFSEILKGKNELVLKNATKYYKEFERYTITIFTLVEILKGYYKAGFKDVAQKPFWDEKESRLFSAIPDWEILNLDLESCQIAARIFGYLEYKGLSIGRGDPMIAAVAIRYDLTLVTGNTEHYQRVKELGYSLNLENWKE